MIYLYVIIYVHVYVMIYCCICNDICRYLYVMCMCMCTCMCSVCVCVRMRLYLCLCTYKYTYIRIYTHVYTYLLPNTLAEGITRQCQHMYVWTVCVMLCVKTQSYKEFVTHSHLCIENAYHIFHGVVCMSVQCQHR